MLHGGAKAGLGSWGAGGRSAWVVGLNGVGVPKTGAGVSKRVGGGSKWVLVCQKCVLGVEAGCWWFEMGSGGSWWVKNRWWVLKRGWESRRVAGA